MKITNKQNKSPSIKNLLRAEDLTVEEIKRCNLFSHFTEEQVLEVADTIKQFCYEPICGKFATSG